MRLGTLTALDLAGVLTRRQADGSYHHSCVACGSAARTGLWHSQCANPNCDSQVFSPLDVVAAKFGGDHRAAADFTNDRLRRTAVDGADVAWEQTRRKVMDFWLHQCLTGQPTTMQMAAQAGALRDKGYLLLPGQRGMAVVSAATISKLVELATDTGADFPDVMTSKPPATALAYVVQSKPHTIDRIVITTGRDQEWAVTWGRKRVGIIGMLGSGDHHFLASDYRAALALQLTLHDVGRACEVAAVYIDNESVTSRESWKPDVGHMTAVVANTKDVVSLAAFYDAFPTAAESLPTTHARSVVSLPVTPPVSWSWMRRSYMAASIENDDRELSGATMLLLEQAQPSREEVAWLVQRYREKGMLELAEDLKRHMDNRVIGSDGKAKIRETASDYLIDYGGSTSSIANFALRFTHNLFFRDSADVFHAATLLHGRSSLRVAVSSHAIDSTNELQKVLRHQTLIQRSSDSPDSLPTVIDVSAMRRHVTPYLKRQISTLPSREGFCNMGWTADRGMFVGPGVKVTMNGREHGPVDRHPGVAPLKHFDDDGNWDVGFAEDLPVVARDLVSMILASCVRYFVKGVTKPVCVQHSAHARHLLTTMFVALGQREIFELNPNVRDATGTHGVRGYPFLTTGYNAAQAMGARFGHVLLTDTGYSVTEEVNQDTAEAAGRSLQFGLLRLAEWCLATGAVEFSERPALHYNSSLLREGKWLIEHVCELQPWEVSDIGLTHLEDLFAQIPVKEVASRMAIRDGTVLTANLAGLNWDRDALRQDLTTLRSLCEGDGDELVMGAVEVLPAMETYYGMRPEVTVVI